jgi:hypothetical protein
MSLRAHREPTVLVVRDHQVAALRDAAVRRFHGELVEHLAHYAPELARILGPTRMRDVVERGVEEAAGHGFGQRGPVRFYLELMFSLGTSFSSDPCLPFAASMLQAPASGTELERADRLHAATSHYMDAVAGPNADHAMAALQGVRDRDLDAFGSALGLDADRALEELTRGYPQKAAYVGEHGLRALIADAEKACDALQVESSAGRFLLLVLMYGFGHGALTDPLYPWIAATLRDERRGDPETRVRRLHRKVRTYISEILHRHAVGSVRAD